MLAIQTKYLGPTNYRGSRIVANVMEESRPPDRKTRLIYINWDDELSSVDNHEAAAAKLIRRLE